MEVIKSSEQLEVAIFEVNSMGICIIITMVLKVVHQTMTGGINYDVSSILSAACFVKRS